MLNKGFIVQNIQGDALCGVSSHAVCPTLKVAMAAKAHFVKEYNLVALGMLDAGKTSLLVRFTMNYYSVEYDPTIEDTYRKQCVIDKEAAIVEVPDPGCQDDYYSTVIKHYLGNAEGVLLVYSIISRNSFLLLDTFYKQIVERKGQSFPMIIVGTKCDLEQKRQVSVSEAQDVATRFGCTIIETSAKNGINVDEPFFALVREIMRQNKQSDPVPEDIVDDRKRSSKLTSTWGDSTAGCKMGCIVV